MTQTNMISFKNTHVNENNSYNKPFTIRIEQIFKCSLKQRQLIKIKYYLSSEKRQALLSLKAQKTQDDSWFYCKQVQEMALRTLPETVVYQVQVDKGEVLRHIWIDFQIYISIVLKINFCTLLFIAVLFVVNLEPQ